jgi:hypothetical protein
MDNAAVIWVRIELERMRRRKVGKPKYDQLTLPIVKDLLEGEWKDGLQLTELDTHWPLPHSPVPYRRALRGGRHVRGIGLFLKIYHQINRAVEAYRIDREAIYREYDRHYCGDWSDDMLLELHLKEAIEPVKFQPRLMMPWHAPRRSR